MSGESSVSSSGGNHNVVPYDYSHKKADSGKVPKFNGDPEEFSWWKTNFYSYIMGFDEELWDILEDGVGDLDLDEEGTTVDRKKHTPTQKKIYKKHCNALIVILLFLVDFSMFYVFYMKMSIYVIYWCLLFYYMIILLFNRNE